MITSSANKTRKDFRFSRRKKQQGRLSKELYFKGDVETISNYKTRVSEIDKIDENCVEKYNASILWKNPALQFRF